MSDEVQEYRQFRFERPPGATELLLVRHGETMPSRADRPFPLVDGHGDPELTPEGHEQAVRAAARLVVEEVDAIYVTNLRRTAQTAEPLVERVGIEPVIERDFREVHLGDWEGGEFRRRVAELDPLAVRMWEEQRWDVIPGAEPADTFATRVRGAVERVAAAHPDQRVAVFTHGGVIGQVLAEATRSSAFAFAGADNGSISHVVIVEGRWIVRRYNDTAHLDPRFTLHPAPLT